MHTDCSKSTEGSVNPFPCRYNSIHQLQSRCGFLVIFTTVKKLIDRKFVVITVNSVNNEAIYLACEIESKSNMYVFVQTKQIPLKV